MTNNIKLKNINLSDKLKSENITSKSVIEIFEYIQKGCLGFVLNRIAELTKVGSLTTAEHSEINCELNEIQSTYKFLIKYAIEGIPDSEREEMLIRLQSKLFMLVYKICMIDKVRKKNSGTLFGISHKSVAKHRLIDDVSEYINLCRKTEVSINDFSLSSTIVKQADAILTNIFLNVWTSYPLTENKYRELKQLVDNTELPTELRMQLISALTLMSVDTYDSKAISLLLSAYYSNIQINDSLAAIALTGVVIAILSHNTIFQYDLENFMTFSKINKDNLTCADVKHVLLNLAYTRETENINRTIKNEIIPEITRVRSDLINDIKEIKKDGIDSIEENPKWEKMLNNNGLGNKLKKLSDWQMDGADVMMSAFADLKNSAFFRSVNHWFLPFNSNYFIKLEGIDDSVSTFITMMEGQDSSSIMCDSDKYSFAYAIAKMPKAQRDMIVSQLGIQLAELKKENATSLNLGLRADREKEICRAVRSLFRFYRQFYCRNEFNDPFVYLINNNVLNSFPVLCSDEELKIGLAEFYMSRGFYEDAASFYNVLIDNSITDNNEELYQRLGFCLQKSGNIEEALDKYKKAEIINDKSSWLIKQIANCNKKVCNYSLAAEYYDKLLQLSPDDISLMINEGNCLFEIGEYEKALKLYYKADYLKSNNIKVLRPMAWSLLMLGKYEECNRIYQKIITSKLAEAADFIGYGHLLLCLKDTSKAIEQYKRAEQIIGSHEAFIKMYDKDRELIDKLGIDNNILQLIPDAIVFW